MDDPISDKPWPYRGMSNGRLIEGIVLAKSAVEAKTKLERLRIEKATLAGEEPEPQVTEPPKKAIIPGSPSKDDLAVPHTVMAGIEQIRESASKTVEKMSIPLGRRKQSLVVCKAADIPRRVDPILSSGGRIINMTMHPDVHGDMVLALVIERED